jgi:hypothetical protein
MESSSPQIGLSRQQHLWIAGLIWTVVGAGLLTMGSVFWFHLPYLGDLDVRHLGIGMAAIAVGLAKGRFVLDKTANRVIDRTANLQEANPLKSIFQMFGVKTIALIASMMGIGLILRMAGMSYEIRGLIYLAVGTALLWSCVRYWSAAGKTPEVKA